MSATLSPSSPLLLGLDVGTSGCKAVLIDSASGATLASATSEYPLSTPHPLWAEQNPEDWWTASCSALRKVIADARIDVTRLKGLGLTGQMHGLVLLDKTGRVLRPAILWNDQRTGVSGGECEAITRLLTRKGLIELTGNLVLPGFTAPKILWVRQHEPEVYAKVAHILLPKDYVRFRLTGAHAIDMADASGTSLLDVSRRQWSSEMLSALDIPRAWLPTLHESTDIASTVSPAGAGATGLPAGLPVAAGAGDQAAQAVGTGIVAQGSVSVTIGTSGVVFAACDSYRFEPEGRLHAFCHAAGAAGAPGAWHLMGVMLSAGGSLRWYRDTLCAQEIADAKNAGIDPYERIMAQAAQSQPGARGLIFLPYLTGERTPHPDPHARGAFIGLTLQHTKSDLARSVIEGVTFGLRDCLDLLTDAGVVVREVRASGGGARSALWRQILADTFEVPILTVNSSEGAAYGAALLAGVGTQVWPDVAQAAAACVRITGRSEPQHQSAAIYRECHALYRSLYPKLEASFPALGRCATLRTDSDSPRQ